MVDDQLFLHAGICTIILTCQIFYILSIILMHLWKIYLLQDVGSLNFFSHPIVNHILLHSVIIHLLSRRSKPIFEFEIKWVPMYTELQIWDKSIIKFRNCLFSSHWTSKITFALTHIQTGMLQLAMINETSKAIQHHRYQTWCAIF